MRPPAHSRATDRRSTSKCQGKWSDQAARLLSGRVNAGSSRDTARRSCGKPGKTQQSTPTGDSSGESRISAKLMHWYDVAGSLGVAMIVCAYLFLQLGRVASDSLRYLLANALGAGLILISLSMEFNFSAFLIEAFWLAISVVGLWRRTFAR